MKRITTLLTFLLLASIFLAACGPAETAVPDPAGDQPAGEEPAEVGDQPVTIDLWQHDSGGKISGMEAVIEKFNEQYPNITITQTVVPYDDYQTKIAASVPAGTGPDVAMSYFGWIPLWAKSGFIAPLPDDLATEIDNEFVPFAQVTKVDGKQYSVLTSVRNFALFINTTHTEEAGIDRAPETWDEFAQFAKQCTKTDANGNITQAGYFLGWEEDGWNFYRPMIESFGGKWGSDDGRETLFNKSDEAKQAWQYMLDLTTVHKVSTPGFYEGESSAFAAGLTCYSLGLTFSVGFFTENMAPGMEWTVAPVPSGPAGSFTTGSSWPLVLTTKAANDPAKYDAAIKFMKFMATAEGQTAFNDVTLELPSRTDMLNDPKYTENPTMEPFIKGLPQTNGPFLVDELAQRQCAFDMYNSVLKNNVDPMVALDEGAACDQALRDSFFSD